MNTMHFRLLVFGSRSMVVVNKLRSFAICKRRMNRNETSHLNRLDVLEIRGIT